MRISIRVQLALLVFFTSLVALAVVALAVWFTNRPFVLGVRSDGLQLTASLKAEELTSNIIAMRSAARALATRALLQNALRSANNGHNNTTAWSLARSDLEQALSISIITLSSAVFAESGKDPSSSKLLMNATRPDYIRTYQLPFTLPDGSQPYLGDPAFQEPSGLYPNFTYSSSGVSFEGGKLDATSSILLGPLQLNSTFSLSSLTLPIANISNNHVLGWLTVVLDSRLIYQVTESPQGLGTSGLTLLLGPTDRGNRFSQSILFNESSSAKDQQSVIENTQTRFILGLPNTTATTQRHPDQAFGESNPSFRLGSYPAALAAISTNQNNANNAGADVQTTNEAGEPVSVGWAILNSTSCDWILLIEQSRGEVFQPIYHLRRTLLACVFGTLGAFVILVIPIAELSSRPIRRLRNAVTLNKPSGKPRRVSGKSDAGGSVADLNGSVEKSQQSNQPRNRWWNALKGHFSMKSSGVPDHESLYSENTFIIPKKVQEDRHFIIDELVDLTATFNMMVDELEVQYTQLDERVKERTAQLETSKRAAEAANESKTLFIANISHELRTPLNGILGMCGLCTQESDLEKIRRSMNIALNSGELLNHLLTDLLTFSRNQGNHQIVIDEKQFNLRDVGTQLRAIFDNQAKASNVQLGIQYVGLYDAPGVADAGGKKRYGPGMTGKVKNMRVFGDQQRILQIMINLVSNSLKFTPAEGSVHVRIHCVSTSDPTVHRPSPSPRGSTQSLKSWKQLNPLNSLRRSVQGDTQTLVSSSPRIESPENETPPERTRRSSISTSGSDTRHLPQDSQDLSFVLEVEDTGPGIAKDLQTHIFEPFVQGDIRLTKKYGGTGLGLSICSQLAELMKGTIKVESDVGAGSKFTLSLPLKLAGTRADSVAGSSATVSRVNSFVQHSSIVEGEKATGVSATGTPTDPADTSKPKPFDSSSKPRLVGLSQPFFSTQTPPLASPEDGQDKRGSKVRVLVAEDNAVNQEVVLRMLRLEDVFDVHVAKDGLEAYDRVKESMEQDKPFDLIFMDVQVIITYSLLTLDAFLMISLPSFSTARYRLTLHKMPNLDGRESTRKIRQAGYSAPIIALTAFSDESNRLECIESGMDYFLAKPIRRPALKHVLKRYCPPIQEVEESAASENPFDAKAGKPQLDGNERGHAESPLGTRKEVS